MMMEYGRNGGSSIQREGHATDVSDHVGISGGLGWTRPDKREDNVQVGARQSKSFEHRLKAGDVLHWRVAIDAFDIRVRTSFIAAQPSAEQNPSEPVDQKVGNDGLTGVGGDALSGDYEALVEGVFQLTLDNTYSKLRGARSLNFPWEVPILLPFSL